jgi:hypothetical protein
MTRFPQKHGDFFNGAFAAVAMIGPILLVIAASTMPVDPTTGKFVVYGHGVLLAVLSAALVLRAAYAVGFSKALKIAALEQNYSVAA